MTARITLHTVIAAFAVATFMSACDNSMTYNTYKHIPLDGWDKSDEITFDVPRIEDEGRYRMEVELRTNTQFPFTGLTLVVEQTIEPGRRVLTDTISCKLSDEKGNILGQGVSNFQYDFILNDTELHKGDSLHVAIHHIMKRETVPGVTDLGLRMTRR